MNILNFGSMNNDYVYGVAHFVQPGETLSVRSMQCFAGGKGLNQSIAIARAGQKVFHAGLYGRGGEALAQTLEEEGVDVRHIRACDEFQGQALIQVDEAGENCILVYGGSNAALSTAYIDEVLSAFDENTYVLLQNEINHVGYIIEKAARLGMKVVLNPAPFTHDLLAIDLSLVSWLVINEVEGAGITGETSAEGIVQSLTQKYPRMGVLYTRGAQGVICAQGAMRLSHGVYATSVVDTTAAGDTFIGYFMAGIVAGEPLEESLRMASIASALCIGRSGASPSIPRRQEVVMSQLQMV